MDLGRYEALASSRRTTALGRAPPWRLLSCGIMHGIPPYQRLDGGAEPLVELVGEHLDAGRCVRARRPEALTECLRPSDEDAVEAKRLGEPAPVAVDEAERRIDGGVGPLSAAAALHEPRSSQAMVLSPTNFPEAFDVAVSVIGSVARL